MSSMHEITFSLPETEQELREHGRLVRVVFDGTEVWEWKGVLMYKSSFYIGPVGWDEQFDVVWPH